MNEIANIYTYTFRIENGAGKITKETLPVKKITDQFIMTETKSAATCFGIGRFSKDDIGTLSITNYSIKAFFTEPSTQTFITLVGNHYRKRIDDAQSSLECLGKATITDR